MVRQSALALFAVATLAGGCGTSAGEIEGVEVRYRSPPYPSPFAYSWTIVASRGGDLVFEKTFSRRDESEHAAADDFRDLSLTLPLDSDWESRIFGAATGLRGSKSRKVGGSQIEATYTTSGRRFEGEPSNPEAWRRIAEDLAFLADALRLDGGNAPAGISTGGD